MSHSRKAAATLAALLAFGIASSALADANSQTVYGALVDELHQNALSNLNGALISIKPSILLDGWLAY